MDAAVGARRFSVALSAFALFAIAASHATGREGDAPAQPPPATSPAAAAGGGPRTRPYKGVVVPSPLKTETLAGTIKARHGDPWTHVFDIGEDVVGIDATLENLGGDADLSIGFGDEEPDDWTVTEDDDAYREHATIDRACESDWETGPLYVEVDASSENDGATDTDEIHFKFTLNLLRRGKPTPLALGTVAEGATGPESAHRAEFVVDVPKDVATVRLDLLDAERDLDLYVRRGKFAAESGDADVVSESYRIRETLLVGGAGMKLAAGEKLFVSVIDGSEYELPVRFRLAATAGTAAPRDLPPVPPLPLPATARERSLAAVVEVIAKYGSGSGVLVSEGGLVLTAQHIVDDGAKAGDVTIAFDFDPTDVTLDLFTARTVKEDKDLDLALLQIVSDLWGRPLAAGYRFPHCRAGARDPLRLAEELYTVGFGDTGGNGTRNPVTVSRGVLAGFEREQVGLRAKTDAQIVSGTSGGAVLDRDFGLVGIALFSISGSKGRTRLGYFQPMAELPAEWKKALDGGR